MRAFKRRRHKRTPGSLTRYTYNFPYHLGAMKTSYLSDPELEKAGKSLPSLKGLFGECSQKADLQNRQENFALEKLQISEK